MAVRPIDGNELYRIEKLLDTNIVRQDKVALNLLEQVLYDIQHVPTLTPPNEWVNVEERLPGVSGNYICAVKDKNGSVWTIPAEWSLEMKMWIGAFGEIKNIVTHWMPLPASPDKDNNVPAKTPNEPLTVLVNDEPDREYIDYICPRCKNTISQRRRGQRMETVYKCKFHDNCGQRVDWSNPQPYRRPPEGEEDT